MMFHKPFHIHMRSLMEALGKAHRSKGLDAEPADRRFQQNVMQSIHGLAVTGAGGSQDFFATLSWRLIPAAAALLALMICWTALLDDHLEFQIASLVVSDPAHTDVYNPF